MSTNSQRQIKTYTTHQDLKMSIVCSGKLITTDNAYVIGDNNIIHGSYSTVFGNGNAISGIRARVKGDCNIVSGSNSEVIGDGNNVSGNHSLVDGTNNCVSGNHSVVRGANNLVTGRDCQVANTESGTPFANQRNNADSIFFAAGNVFFNTETTSTPFTTNQSNTRPSSSRTNSGQVQNNNAGRVIYVDGNVTINTTAATTTTSTRTPDRQRTMPVSNDPDGTNIDGVVELTYPDEERPDGAPCCVVCMSREPDVIAIPCRHKQFCGVCVVGMKNNNSPINPATNKIKCPVCNADVDTFGKVY